MVGAAKRIIHRAIIIKLVTMNTMHEIDRRWSVRFGHHVHLVIGCTMPKNAVAKGWNTLLDMSSFVNWFLVLGPV